MEMNQGGQGQEDELAMVVLSDGSVAWVPAQAAVQNGGRDALVAAVAQGSWVPAEAAARTGWIPSPAFLVLDGKEALAVALQHGWISPDVELEWTRAVLPRNGRDNLAAANASNGNPALYLAFLCLPAQEIARCRTVCTVWRDITRTEAFLRHHRDHHYRTPMPLFFFLDPTLARLNLRAVDILNRVSRPVICFNRPSNREVLRIHGSSAGILLLSSGRRLYAFNPCTRRWARLPPLHVEHDIIGFYVTPGSTPGGDFECNVLYHDRKKPEGEVLFHVRESAKCSYWIFTLDTAEEAQRRIGRPGPGEVDLVLAKGIAPSYKIPPVFLRGFLHWPPQAAEGNTNILVFNIAAETFDLIPPPSSQVGGDRVPVGGRQLFVLGHRLAMTVLSFSPARVDVWVENDITGLWTRRYNIRVPVDAINLNGGCHHNGSVFAVAQDRNDLVQCPRILLQCDAQGAVLQSYQLAGHWTSLSGHTIEESLLLYPSILGETEAVDGDPPFF